MKISEFAQENQVTAKMLRHYDEINLLKPNTIDPATGYRSYASEQCHRLNWILILKNLGFSLLEIKDLLDGPVSSADFIGQLIRKRIEIAGGLNMQIQKKIQIDRLIQLIEAEGFQMERKINLMELTQDGVHELKKNMPNTEVFLEEAQALVKKVAEGTSIGILRADLSHFKAVNDIDGYEMGDKVIVACYQSIENSLSAFKDMAFIGRAGGDEFIAIVIGEMAEVQGVAEGVVAEMKHIDFKTMGCHKQVAVYVGALMATKGDGFNLRQMIDDTHESLMKAKLKGENGICVECL